ncbi:DUF998 domain-containing protein [Streptomyces vinaceus]|uniref:DUF998 domain-containing protein n=1 Tax=Streptomyces vinaceus TaxID=1960 RepID=A0A5J6JLS6_STRVI|nr:DUF998 domain-containing protein [Streptomyces vinaceus]QEV49444.1 DUF998 domain-containing protein [Streptomyces vinaceus]
MLPTLSASVHVAPVAPASTVAARRWLLGAVAAGPVFLAVGVALGFARDGFDFSRMGLSQLALGEGGWVQTVNFLLAGALLVMGAVGLHETRPPRPAPHGPGRLRLRTAEGPMTPTGRGPPATRSRSRGADHRRDQSGVLPGCSDPGDLAVRRGAAAGEVIAGVRRA